MKSKLRLILIINLFSVMFYVSKAQVISTASHPYDYGNGSNGAYSPSSSTTLPGGVYNYTSVNIPSGVTITVTGTAPLIIKCTGTVTINGTIKAVGGNGGNSTGSSSAAAAGAAGPGGGKAGGAGGASPDDGDYGNNGINGNNAGSCSGAGLAGQGGGIDAFGEFDDTPGGGGGGASYGMSGNKGGNGQYSIQGGAAGTIYSDANLSQSCGGSTNILGGSGGGGGGGFDGWGSDCFTGGHGSGGAGGGGGGGGIAIIAQTVDLTGGTINVSGGNGGLGSETTDTYLTYGTCYCQDICDYSGSGGGGSGGTVLLEYHNSCTSCSTSSVNINGGNGGNPGGGPAGGNGGQGRFLALQDNCASPVLQDTISNQTKCQGDSITFTVNATGDNLSYQWIMNSSNISGATNSVYNTGKITSSNNIIYSCKISNGCGSKTLSPFTLFVNLLPSSNTIYTQETKYVGDSVSYSASAAGTSPFIYQWLKNDTDITNATNSTFGIKSLVLGDSGIYKCVITNLCGSTSADIAQLYVQNVRFKFNISGLIRYDNTDTSAMSSETPNTLTTVYLLNSSDVNVDSMYTDSIGGYLFANIINGKYTLKCKTNKPWGGVNPIDALLANRTYIGLYILNDSLKRLAADVNNDGKINPIDALLINRRYIRLVSKFTIPDWLFESAVITVSGADVKKNILSICAGDVNGSYTPPK